MGTSKKVVLTLENDNWTINVRQGNKTLTLNGQCYSDEFMPKSFNFKPEKLNYQVLKLLAEATLTLQKERI